MLPQPQNCVTCFQYDRLEFSSIVFKSVLNKFGKHNKTFYAQKIIVFQLITHDSTGMLPTPHGLSFKHAYAGKLIHLSMQSFPKTVFVILNC